MIEILSMSNKPKYKRHKGDNLQQCPYCSHGFNTGVYTQNDVQVGPRIYKRMCRNCFKYFIYRYCSSSYAKEHNLKMTWTMEEWMKTPIEYV